MTDPRLFPATAMPDTDWWAALWPDPEGVLRKLGAGPGTAAVDLCCGDGRFTAPLARIAAEVVALDIDPEMLRRAEAEAARQGATVARWIEGDARDLAELLDRPVDFVLIANTFHGVPNKAALARAAAAVLKPEGRFAVVNWHARPRAETPVLGKPRGPRDALRMTPEAVAAAVEPAGFALERLVELPPYHYGAVFRKAETAA